MGKGLIGDKMEETVKKYCNICGKEIGPNNTYRFKDGTQDQCCKDCRIMGCCDTQPWTFFPIMKIFDIPYIEREWFYDLRRAFKSNTYRTSFKSIFGKYLAKMYLKDWRVFSFQDSKEINSWFLKKDNDSNKYKILRDFLISDQDSIPKEYLEIVGKI